MVITLSVSQLTGIIRRTIADNTIGVFDIDNITVDVSMTMMPDM